MGEVDYRRQADAVFREDVEAYFLACGMDTSDPKFHANVHITRQGYGDKDWSIAFLLWHRSAELDSIFGNVLNAGCCVTQLKGLAHAFYAGSLKDECHEATGMAPELFAVKTGLAEFPDIPTWQPPTDWQPTREVLAQFVAYREKLPARA